MYVKEKRMSYLLNKLWRLTVDILMRITTRIYQIFLSFCFFLYLPTSTVLKDLSNEIILDFFSNEANGLVCYLKYTITVRFEG